MTAPVACIIIERTDGTRSILEGEEACEKYLRQEAHAYSMAVAPWREELAFADLIRGTAWAGRVFSFRQDADETPEEFKERVAAVMTVYEKDSERGVLGKSPFWVDNDGRMQARVVVAE